MYICTCVVYVYTHISISACSLYELLCTTYMYVCVCVGVILYVVTYMYECVIIYKITYYVCVRVNKWISGLLLCL